MSYSTYIHLPPQVRKSFSYDDAMKWMDLYNEEYENHPLRDDGLGEIDTVCRDAYLEAWKGMRFAPSSRSFVAQVAVEDEDVWGDTPIVSEYLDIAHTLIDDGGVGTDEHSSKHVWCVWDMTGAIDNEGREAIVIQGNFFRDKPAFDISWNRFLEGRSQFSMGSYADTQRICDRYRCKTTIHPAHLFEISIVDTGASPNTGVINVNVPEGEGTFNPKNMVKGSEFKLKTAEGSRVCILEEIYNGLKKELELILDYTGEEVEWSYSYMSDMGIHIVIPDSHIPVVWDTILEWSYGVFAVPVPVSNNPLRLEEGMTSDGSYQSEFVLIPYSSFTPFDEVTISDLIIDEERAIRAYEVAIEEAKLLFGDKSEDAIRILEHIRDEEYEHIEELLELLIMHNYEIVSRGRHRHNELPRMFLKNRPGIMEGVTNCPPGQHSHPGVEGCHDVMRIHTDLISSNPEGKIDLTDENIDVNAIKEMDTENLKAIVLTIAKIMTKFSDDKVAEYMQTPGGKEFTLMFTELVNRNKQEKGDNMKEGTEDLVVKEKSLIDPVTDNSALLTVIADLKSKVEHLTSIVLSQREATMANQEHSGNISDAIESAVGAVGSQEPEDGESAIGNADGGDDTITEGTEEDGYEGGMSAKSETDDASIGDPDNVSSDEIVPKVSEEVVEEPEPKDPPIGESKEDSEESDGEDAGEEEGSDDEDEDGDEKGDKEEGDTMSDEERKKVEEKKKSGAPGEESALDVKEKAGESKMDGLPSLAEASKEEKDEDGKDGKKAKEAVGEVTEYVQSGEGEDAFKAIQKTPEEDEVGIVGDVIPEVPCDAPETQDGTPSIDLSGAGEQEDSDGVGVKPSGEPGGGGESVTVDTEGGKPEKVGGEKLKGSGIPGENITPTEIPKGPIETKLEDVAHTGPYTDDAQTWELGVNWDTGIEPWVNNSREVLRSAGSIKREVNPLETRVHYKTADEGVVVVKPEGSVEGTGLKLSDGGTGGRDFEALWDAVGKDNETFLKIKKEVLR